MQVQSIQSNMYCGSVSATKDINFGSTKQKSNVPNYVIKHFGLNIEMIAGYKGKKSVKKPPKSLSENTARYLRMLQVDWKTHSNKKNSLQ